MASLNFISRHAPEMAFAAWLRRQPGNVRRGPEAEQRRQFVASLKALSRRQLPNPL
jgi:hypothetical protein